METKYRTCLSVAAALLTALAGPAGAGDSQKIREVDFSGPPPFKRQTVTRPAEAADFARFEAEAPVAGEQVREVDFSGRPPYRRTVRTISEKDVAEFARFEEVVEADDARPRRLGPPGKNLRYRRR